MNCCRILPRLCSSNTSNNPRTTQNTIFFFTTSNALKRSYTENGSYHEGEINQLKAQISRNGMWGALIKSFWKATHCYWRCQVDNVWKYGCHQRLGTFTRKNNNLPFQFAWEREKAFCSSSTKTITRALLSVPHKDQFCKGPIFLMPPPHQMENATQLFAGLNCWLHFRLYS